MMVFVTNDLQSINWFTPEKQLIGFFATEVSCPVSYGLIMFC